MDDSTIRKRSFNGSELLVRSVSRKDFGREVVRFVSEAALIRSFGTYYFPTKSPSDCVLSFWGGAISSYWFRKNASDIISSAHFKSTIHRDVRAVSAGKVVISLWRPPQGHQLSSIFRRVGVLERVSVTTRGDSFSSRSFFLRNINDGPISRHEFEALTEILPMAHELIVLRHQVVGSDAYEYLPKRSVSRLRARGIPIFLSLSPRETEVCDCLAKGLSVQGTAFQLGISEATVKTLRRRSYRRLRISSAYELLAMLAKGSEPY